jgi:hypothetical protein
MRARLIASMGAVWPTGGQPMGRTPARASGIPASKQLPRRLGTARRNEVPGCQRAFKRREISPQLFEKYGFAPR